MRKVEILKGDIVSVKNEFNLLLPKIGEIYSITQSTVESKKTFEDVMLILTIVYEEKTIGEV